MHVAFKLNCQSKQEIQSAKKSILISKISNKHELIVIKKLDFFLWMMEEFTGDNFFKGKTKKYNLGPYDKLGQMEAVAFKNNSSLYLSSEEIANVPARLYLFKLDDFNK